MNYIPSKYERQRRAALAREAAQQPAPLPVIRCWQVIELTIDPWGRAIVGARHTETGERRWLTVQADGENSAVVRACQLFDEGWGVLPAPASR